MTCWRGLAETVNQFLSKGKQVYVEGVMSGAGENGILNPRVWTAKDGTVRASFEITARVLKFLGGRAAEGEAADELGASEPPADFVEENEIPF